MAKTDLRIETLGTSLSISADEDAVYLQKLLDAYLAAVEKTKENTGLRDPLKIAILTGFLLSDELQKLQNKESDEEGIRVHESREAQALAVSILTRLDEVLEHE